MEFERPVNPPADLIALNQWVVFNRLKQPYNARTGGAASVMDKHTWSTYEQAISEAEHQAHGQWAGVGFIFTADDPFCGIDLDHCVTKENGISAVAQNIIDRVDSYTEYSPSGTGVHMLVRATLPEPGRKNDQIEMYHFKRYFTFTGNYVDGANDIEERQAVVDELFAFHFSERAATVGQVEPMDIDLNARMPFVKWEALCANDKKFKQSWEHKRVDAGMSDQSDSAYDMALAMRALRAGWSDDEVIGLIVEHRTKYGSEEKLVKHKTYITRLFLSAHSTNANGGREKDAGIRMDSSDVVDLTPEDKLATISTRLGVTVQRIIKRGMDPADYLLEVNGRELLVGDIQQLFSAKWVKCVLMEGTGHCMQNFRQEQWDGTVTLMHEVLEVDASDSRPLETLGAIDDYLEGKVITDQAERAEAFPGGDCWEDAEHIWISMKNFYTFIQIYRPFPIREKTKLERRMKEIKIYQKRHTATLTGRKICRSYWGVNKKQLEAFRAINTDNADSADR